MLNAKQRNDLKSCDMNKVLQLQVVWKSRWTTVVKICRRSRSKAFRHGKHSASRSKLVCWRDLGSGVFGSCKNHSPNLSPRCCPLCLLIGTGGISLNTVCCLLGRLGFLTNVKVKQLNECNTTPLEQQHV